MNLKKQKIIEDNAAFEGAFWSVKKRLHNLDELYYRYKKLTPFSFKPFVKSFKSFEEYEIWKKKQKNPWYW